MNWRKALVYPTLVFPGLIPLFIGLVLGYIWSWFQCGFQGWKDVDEALFEWIKG